jgi:hypothetical protein
MSKSPTVYLFVNKDSASASLSRSHGKDASAILSHVQSCRNQKNKQLHMFRVDDGSQESVRKRALPSAPSSPTKKPVLLRHPISPRAPPLLRSEASSSSYDSATSSPLSPVSSQASGASPHPGVRQTPELDELVEFFDSLCLTTNPQLSSHTSYQDLYQQVVSCGEFHNFSWPAARDRHGSAMLACTAARMASEMPDRREEFEIKATKYLQPSLQYMREQLAHHQSRTLTDRQILREMLLHCVTNCYLRDWTAAKTHLNAMNCLTGCLDVSRDPDRKFMDVILQCGLYIAQHSRRDSAKSLLQTPERRSSRAG